MTTAFKSAIAASAIAAAMIFNPMTASASDFKFGVYFDRTQDHAATYKYQQVRHPANPNKQFRRLFDGPAPSARHLQRHKKRGLHRKFDRFGERVCASPRQIHRRLRRQGWFDFHDLRIRRRALIFKAVRNNGLIYRLKIDKCTGYLLKAKLAWGQYWAYLFGGDDYYGHDHGHGYRYGRH